MINETILIDVLAKIATNPSALDDFWDTLSFPNINFPTMGGYFSGITSPNITAGKFKEIRLPSIVEYLILIMYDVHGAVWLQWRRYLRNLRIQTKTLWSWNNIARNLQKNYMFFWRFYFNNWLHVFIIIIIIIFRAMFSVSTSDSIQIKTKFLVGITGSRHLYQGVRTDSADHLLHRAEGVKAKKAEE